MRPPELKCYSFFDEAHWRTGVREGLHAVGGGLMLPPALAFEPVPDTGPADGRAPLAFDRIGRLYWLPRDGVLRRLITTGIEEVATLDAPTAARAIVIDGARLWVLHEGGLALYATRDFQQLAAIPHRNATLDIAPDGHDGIWLLEREARSSLVIRRLDRQGRPVALEERRDFGETTPRLASFRDGRRIALLECTPAAAEAGGSCRGPAGWRVWLVDLCDPAEQRWRAVEGPRDDDPAKPELIAIDAEGTIHVAFTERGDLWSFSAAGDLVARHKEIVPGVRSLAAGLGIAAGTAHGIGRLVVGSPGAEVGEPALGRLITPTLVSPELPVRGWMRAEIEALLPAGTSLTVDVAATRDPTLLAYAQSVFADAASPAADKLAALDARLAWRPEARREFASDESGRPQRLRFALHEIEETHLWLKLEAYRPPGRGTPRIERLDVLYPNLSLMRFLPEAYAADRTAAARLRRFLAPFECLIGDLDARVHALPEEIDPRTTSPQRLAFLLRWLGLPTPEHMSPAIARRLLLAAPALLEKRGTLSGLTDLLEILAEGARVAIEDAAAGPLPWVLPTTDGSLAGARLGCDTLVYCADPPAFRPGATALLGHQALGRPPADPAAMLTRDIGEIRIEIAAARERRDDLASLIQPFLDVFVPAHCRVTLVFTAPHLAHRGGRLDRDLRLADPRCPLLGTDTVLGGFRLPEEPVDSNILDQTAATGIRPSLQ
jgi:phage tail-like protein